MGGGGGGKVHSSLSNFLRWTCTPENSEIQSFEMASRVRVHLSKERVGGGNRGYWAWRGVRGVGVRGLLGDSKTESRLEATSKSRKSVFWCFDYSSLTVSTGITYFF